MGEILACEIFPPVTVPFERLKLAYSALNHPAGEIWQNVAVQALT